MNELNVRLSGMPPDKRDEALELPDYLAKAGDAERLCLILTNFDFMQAKIALLGATHIVADYDAALTPEFTGPDESAESLRLIQAALRMSSYVFARDGSTSQLSEQLFGRLLSRDTKQIR